MNKRGAKKARRATKAAVKARGKPSDKAEKAPPKLSPEDAEIQSEFLTALDGVENFDWTLGDLTVKYTRTMHQGKLRSGKYFYKNYVKPLRPNAPEYEKVELFARVAKVWPKSYAALGMSKLDVTLSLLYFMRVPIPPDPRTAQIPVPTDYGGTVTKSFNERRRYEEGDA